MKNQNQENEQRKQLEEERSEEGVCSKDKVLFGVYAEGTFEVKAVNDTKEVELEITKIREKRCEFKVRLPVNTVRELVQGLTTAADTAEKSPGYAWVGPELMKAAACKRCAGVNFVFGFGCSVFRLCIPPIHAKSLAAKLEAAADEGMLVLRRRGLPPNDPLEDEP